MRALLISFMITASSIAFSQTVSCDELISYCENNGRFYQMVSSTILLIEPSSWLYEVKAYYVEEILVVIAKIKRDAFGFNTKKYIFCNVPYDNWFNFNYSFLDLNSTYGERFRKYIYDYQCDCTN